MNLDGVLEAFDAVDVDVMPEGVELDQAVWKAEQIRRRAEAVIADLVGESERSVRYLADGHRSAKSWVMAVTNCSPGEAAARHRSARAMRVLPEVAAEFRAGRVGVAQVREVGRLVANPRCGDLVAGSEQVLLEAAKELEYVNFVVVTRRWEQLADADGAHQKHERTEQNRNASLLEVDGEYQWRSSHGPLAGSIMQQVFDKFVDAQFRADWAATVAEHGDRASAALMPRSAAQRRADALLQIFNSAAAHGIDGRPVDVTVNLVMDHDQYEQYLRSMLDGTDVVIDPADVRDRRCETTDGVPVDPREVVALSLVGHVRRVVVNSAGVIVNAGRRQRLYTGQLRELLKAMDPRCSWLGCLIRAAVAQLDHTNEWANGGRTDAANGKNGCGHHNLFRTINGYTLAPDNHHHRTDYQRPDGTVLKPPDAA